jgi:hypothetical protein
MPVEFFATHPQIIGLNTAALGTLWRLLLHFWMTDCAPLPDTDYALFLLSRSHKPTWASYKAEIREILADVTPELAEALALYRKRSSILRHLSDRGHSIQRATRVKADQKVMPPMPESYTPRQAERNRAPAPVAHVKQSGSGFTDKPR